MYCAASPGGASLSAAGARRTPRKGLANAHVPPGTLLTEIRWPRSRLGMFS
jgi:hypothetical protein